MQRLKMAIGKIYHGKRGIFGEIWADRYRSTFIEPGHASRVIAAWVDHGISRECPGVEPGRSSHLHVRSGLRRRQRRARGAGQAFLHSPCSKMEFHPRRLARISRCPPPGNAKTRATTQEGVPPLTRAELMLHPVPAFGAGLAAGSQDFTARLFSHNRGFFKTAVRSTGPRHIVGQNDRALFTLRDKGDLRKPPRRKTRSPLD